MSPRQDHTAADKIARIQRDLDETKVILHQTIEGVLKRGEKLDALVDKSNDLSLASQMFYKQVRHTAPRSHRVNAHTPWHLQGHAPPRRVLRAWALPPRMHAGKKDQCVLPIHVTRPSSGPAACAGSVALPS